MTTASKRRPGDKFTAARVFARKLEALGAEAEERAVSEVRAKFAAERAKLFSEAPEEVRALAAAASKVAAEAMAGVAKALSQLGDAVATDQAMGEEAPEDDGPIGESLGGTADGPDSFGGSDDESPLVAGSAADLSGLSPRLLAEVPPPEPGSRIDPEARRQRREP